MTLWLVCLLILIWLILAGSGCASTPVVIPDDNVVHCLRAGDVVPPEFDGWYVISPGELRKLYRERRIEKDEESR